MAYNSGIGEKALRMGKAILIPKRLLFTISEPCHDTMPEPNPALAKDTSPASKVTEAM